MAAQTASAEKRFCGLLHTVTAEFVDGALARRGEELAGELAAARARRDALEAEAAPLAGLVADKQLNRASARELAATWDRLDADLRALKAPPAPLPPPARASARAR